MLPFTREQFLGVFADYNTAVWPAQVIACAIGLAMALALLRPSPAADRLIGAGLALMWAWTGVAYHLLFFAPVNRAALGFGALFVLQGVLFAQVGALRGRLCFGVPDRPSAWLGWGLLAYSSLVYPLLGMWTGHAYPAMPMFGITPCPVTLFTLGMLALTTAPVPRRLLVIPFIWSLVGGSAALVLGVVADWPLLVSGLAILWLVLRDRRPAPAVA